MGVPHPWHHAVQQTGEDALSVCPALLTYLTLFSSVNMTRFNFFCPVSKGHRAGKRGDEESPCLPEPALKHPYLPGWRES